MTLTHAILRPVPRAGAVLLLLAGAAFLALGGFLAGTALLGSDDRLIFLNDGRLQRASANVEDEVARAAELRAIHQRGGTPWAVSRSIAETNQYYDEMHAARDEVYRLNAKRWRRTQILMGGWMGVAGIGFALAGLRHWQRHGAGPDPQAA